MYAPSSYNDTVTGETLSSVSEKSDSYSIEGSQPDYMDETRKKAESTYMVESSDIPPPRYQKDGTLPMSFSNDTVNSVNTRTLPHPRTTNQLIDPRSRDDQILGKGYMPSPSPALPLDGSYYNMNSDRYLSYPPMDYPSVDYTASSMQMAHIIPTSCGSMTTGSGTLRRGMQIMVPPPDVTHHTNHPKSTHDIHSSINQNVSQQALINHSNKASQLLNNSNLTTSTKLPQGILKDPNRKPQQQQQQHQMHAHANMQILNVQNAPGVGGNLLINSNTVGVSSYDPNTHSLSSFNATMGYTDADGHLV